MALNKAFEEIKEKMANIRRVVKDDADLEWNRAVYKCEEFVNEVAKEYAGGWILCSERLPQSAETGEIILHTNVEGEVDICCLDWFYDNIENMVAWQPLPESYKPE